MRFGTMQTPSHPPHRSLYDGHYHNLDYLKFLDGIGVYEAWIGSHYTVVSEPQGPNDLLIAQGFAQTKNIRLNPGAFIVPFFHPAELAHRIAWLDHISGGRMTVGMGASGVPSDLDMIGVDFRTSQNREMVEESIHMMRSLWASTEPMEIVGKFWTIRHPKPFIDGRLRFHMRPLQQPHPPFAISGGSPNSPTLKLAGKLGMSPMSFCFSTEFIRSHWDSVVEGAETAQREPPPKSEWRLVRETVVAETDEEAMDFAINGPMGQHYARFYLPMLKDSGLLKSVKHHPDVADSDVTIEYLAKNTWTVGSEATVSEKLEELHDKAGGFGVLLANSYDHVDYMEQWRSSIVALNDRIIPKLTEKLDAAQPVAA